MDARTLAKTNGIGRALLGASMVVAPTITGRLWIGDDGEGPATKVLGRALGIRDVVIGAGLIQALDARAPTRGWIAAAAAADAIDAGATLLNWRDLPPVGRALVLALAAGSAVQMGVLAATADE
jgi:hypothetical protein